MEVTPDMIAEFERRAEAGEKPVYPGWESNEFYSFFGDYPVQRLECIRGKWRVGKYGAMFKSLTAAQLAIEHILRAATAPLHRDKVSRNVALKAIEGGMGAGMVTLATEGFGIPKEDVLQIINKHAERFVEAAEAVLAGFEAIARAESEAGK